MSNYERNGKRRTADSTNDSERGGREYLLTQSIDHDERGGEQRQSDDETTWSLRWR